MSYSFHKGETWIIDAVFDIQENDSLAAVTFTVSDTTGPVATLTVGQGVTILDATTGTATVRFTDAQQAPFSPSRRYSYEARITTGAGVKEVQAEGSWVVLPSLSS